MLQVESGLLFARVVSAGPYGFVQSSLIGFTVTHSGSLHLNRTSQLTKSPDGESGVASVL